MDPVLTVVIGDIEEIGGLGWNARLVVGSTLHREISDGVEIMDREGSKWTLTAITLWDELFNGLIAMVDQKLEILAGLYITKICPGLLN